MIGEHIELFVKIAAALGGAVVGFLISGPALRLLYRLAFQRPVPAWLLPVGKLGGALAFAALFFILVSIGGGWGWGLGGGRGGGGGYADGGPGKSKDKGKPPANGSSQANGRVKLEIELLGGAKFEGNGRYYLIDRRTPAKTIEEVETIIQEKGDKLEVHVVLTDESVARSHPAVGRLRELLHRHRVPIVEPPEE